MERNNNASVTFPVYHWKTNEQVGRVVMDYEFKSYYEGATICVGVGGYPFVYVKELVNGELIDAINSKTNRKTMDVHQLNYFIKEEVWSEEGVSCIHHKNRNKMDARLSNLEFKLEWNHDADKLTEDQKQYRKNISDGWKGHKSPNLINPQPNARDPKPLHDCHVCGSNQWKFDNDLMKHWRCDVCRAYVKPDHECYRCGSPDWVYDRFRYNWFCSNDADHDKKKVQHG